MRRRRTPWTLLLVAFIVVPLVEIYVIVKIGEVIGPWWTILVLLADAIFGSWLVKREGRKAWRALRTTLAEGRVPSRELSDGMLVLVGGVFMVCPGFVTDIFGAFCILPFTRPYARRVLQRYVARRLTARVVVDGRAAPRPGHDDVVRGEVVDP